MNSETKEYSPLPREITERILDIWKYYRENIGLEGELVYRMRVNGASEDAIEQAVLKYREDREEMMPLYEEYKEERRKQDQ